LGFIQQYGRAIRNFLKKNVWNNTRIIYHPKNHYGKDKKTAGMTAMPIRRGKPAAVGRFDFDLAAGCAAHRSGRKSARFPRSETIDGSFMPLRRISACENRSGGRISPAACSCFHPGIISPGISTAV